MSFGLVIDADGDILLQFQQQKQSIDEDVPDAKTLDKKPEAKELTVSSKVLSLASPVFKAMLSGNFKESIELAERKVSSKTYTLTLPEEDPEATTILCKILHFSINDVPDKPTPLCLEKLAFLCDKYQCISAMKYCGSLWLRDWLLVYDNEDPSIDDLCRLLIFAYVIDLPHEFLDISWKLFLYHKGPFLGPYTQAVMLVDHPLLRQDIIRELDTRRSKCCQSFHRGIMAPINHNWHTLEKSCYRAAKVVGCYLNSLRKAKILPHGLEFDEHRFCDLIRKASNMPYISVSQYACSLYNCECRNESTFGLSSDLKDEVTLINEGRRTFICLDCLKTDGRSKDEEKCRISH